MSNSTATFIIVAVAVVTKILLGRYVKSVGEKVNTVNTEDAEAVEARKKVEKIVLAHEHVQQIHGFYYDTNEKSMRFDMVVSFAAEDRRKQG